MNNFLKILGYPCWLIGAVMDIILGLPLTPFILLSYRFKLRKLNHFIVKLRLKIAAITSVAPLSMIKGDDFDEEEYMQCLTSLVEKIYVK